MEQLFPAVTPYLILLLTDDETLHPDCWSPKSSSHVGKKGNDPLKKKPKHSGSRNSMIQDVPTCLADMER